MIPKPLFSVANWLYWLDFKNMIYSLSLMKEWFSQLVLCLSRLLNASVWKFKLLITILYWRLCIGNTFTFSTIITCKCMKKVVSMQPDKILIPDPINPTKNISSNSVSAGGQDSRPCLQIWLGVIAMSIFDWLIYVAGHFPLKNNYDDTWCEFLPIRTAITLLQLRTFIIKNIESNKKLLLAAGSSRRVDQDEATDPCLRKLYITPPHQIQTTLKTGQDRNPEELPTALLHYL